MVEAPPIREVPAPIAEPTMPVIAAAPIIQYFYNYT
nr:MAG TPA: hypothetical protein [Microviridae sp.]